MLGRFPQEALSEPLQAPQPLKAQKVLGPKAVPQGQAQG